jgi:hypothetical protein
MSHSYDKDLPHTARPLSGADSCRPQKICKQSRVYYYNSLGWGNTLHTHVLHGE